MKVAVTGSTGSFGTLAIRHLQALNKKDVSIVALARNTAKAADFTKNGIEVRQADYDVPQTLDAALAGIDRLLLVSGSDVGQRARQHGNVIHAAAKAGVGLIVYTSITNAAQSENPLAPEHKTTEELIRKSGIPFVILRNNWYTENYADTLKRARESGVIMAAAGDGRVASATRSELAEAAAKVLIGDADANAGKIYELCGELWDYRQLAAAVSKVTGKDTVYRPVGAAELKAAMLQTGMPEHIADFVVSLDEGIAKGTLECESGDLADLLGRKPKDLREGLADLA